MNLLKKISSPLAFGAALCALFMLPGAASAAQSFTPLTSIPGIAEAAQSADLPAFLNNLYRICIGAAGVLAVLQIIRGGITYMLGDSVTEKREARHHIALAVFGLVLVLAPAIVFGVIDPKILNLTVGVSALDSGQGGTGGPVMPDDPNGVHASICSSYTNLTYGAVGANQTCIDVHGAGWVRIDDTCCTPNAVAGNQCCGQDPNYHAPPVNPADGEFSYSVEFLGEDSEGHACHDSETRGFSTADACNVALTFALTTAGTSVSKSCDGHAVNPPTPTAAWDAVKDLNGC